jgi:glycosyltransferase involved in cell wall biosynthesis
LGGGIKGKILEAMASGIPVVGTQEAADGIECKNFHDILVGNTIDEFADMVIKLFFDDKLYNKISENAKISIEQKYDWKIIAKLLNKFYDESIQFKKNIMIMRGNL